MKTIILAGGLGTRLSEYTNSIPKPMVEIGGKPMLWHIMDLFSKYDQELNCQNVHRFQHETKYQVERK